MNQPFQISNAWVAAMIAALMFDILYPLALGVFARRLDVSWRYFGYGALIFVLFQLVSRVPITAEQRALAAQQLAAIAAQPSWVPLLGAWERLWTIPLHVALALMVLQVFRRGSMRWLWLAILAHTLVDLLAVGVTPILQLRGMPGLLVPEAIVTLVGLLSLLAIWALRDQPDKEPELLAAATQG